MKWEAPISRKMAISTRAQLRVIVAGAFIIFFSLFYFRSSLHVNEHIDSLTTLYDAKENVESEVCLHSCGED